MMSLNTFFYSEFKDCLIISVGSIIWESRLILFIANYMTIITKVKFETVVKHIKMISSNLNLLIRRYTATCTRYDSSGIELSLLDSKFNAVIGKITVNYSYTSQCN